MLPPDDGEEEERGDDRQLNIHKTRVYETHRIIYTYVYIYIYTYMHVYACMHACM